MEIHLTAMDCHLPYGITQCYLPLDTSEHTLRLHPSQPGWYSIYLPQRDGRLSWLCMCHPLLLLLLLVYFSNDGLPKSESRSESTRVSRRLLYILHCDGHIPREAGCQWQWCGYGCGCYADQSSSRSAVHTGTVHWERPGLHVISATFQRSVVWGTITSFSCMLSKQVNKKKDLNVQKWQLTGIKWDTG